MKIDIGEIIRKRILPFQALEKEPKKELVSWGLFPSFTVTEAQFAENLEYRYPALLYSESQAQLLSMTDRTIDAGKQAIDAGRWELHLHAAKIDPPMRVAGRQLYVVRILFIFRAQRVFLAVEANLASSINEIPQDTAAADLGKEKTTKEVKQ